MLLVDVSSVGLTLAIAVHVFAHEQVNLLMLESYTKQCLQQTHLVTVARAGEGVWRCCGHICGQVKKRLVLATSLLCDNSCRYILGVQLNLVDVVPLCHITL
jgi:hypothetical protein